MKSKELIAEQLNKRILVLDGAMGTMIQQLGLTEEDYRGAVFANHPVNLKGNNDVLALSRPDVIASLHKQYLEAGADIIETNTFNANAVSQADYALEDWIEQINLEAAGIARRLADDFTTLRPDKPRFVAGSIGPTNRTASMSPDVNRPGYRAVTFDTLVQAYSLQIKALIKGGVDLLLVETVFDTLNAKAALFAAASVMEELQTDIPVMISATIADLSGRLLTGQTLEAFVTSVSHYPLLSIGLNCAFGAEQLLPYVKQLAVVTPFRVSVHPNAGLPNQLGGYDQSAEMMAGWVEQMVQAGAVNIVGGCCGTTPKHIERVAAVASKYPPRKTPTLPRFTRLSGLEMLEIRPESNFINIGERTNVAGSKKFEKLIIEEKYGEALAIAREQVEGGAQAIDVCMDGALINAPVAITEFLNLVASEPDIARVPVMIDSSRFEVIEAGLKCTQGKSIVNSISLKEGEQEFIRRAKLIRRYGAAVVVMLFDEEGQATTTEHRCRVAMRSYNLLVQTVGFAPEDIIIDPNILAIGTGMAEHSSQAVSFIETTKWIKQNLPYAGVSGGVSNLSFAFRGNNQIREAIHTVFLYHAVNAGMNMGIVNPGMLRIYTDIEPDLLRLTEDLVLNRRHDATERLLAYAHNVKDDKTDDKALPEWRSYPPGKRLEHAIIKGNEDYVEVDTLEAFSIMGSAISVIEGPLMDGMKEVGTLFGSGRMFLPQVVKSARVMKKAVGILEPYISSSDESSKIQKSKGTIVLATVKGDVHDIGKNIVSVVLACMGYEVVDLGVMVPTDKIINGVIGHKADILGLSGLITPSLEEMANVARELEHSGLTIPLLVGGATTSELHTALKIDTEYSGSVIHVKDASLAGGVVAELLSPNQHEMYTQKVKERYAGLRSTYSEQKKALISIDDARQNRFKFDWSSYTPPQPNHRGIQPFLNVDISELRPYISWTFFFHAWGLKGRFPEILTDPVTGSEAKKLLDEANRMLDDIAAAKSIRASGVAGLFPAASQNDDILVFTDETRSSVMATLPQLRNQQLKTNGEFNLSLADYLAPLNSGIPDWLGCFVVTSGIGVDELANKYRAAGDDYKAIMVKLLADRLAEAFAEKLHQQVRKELWGYRPNENLSPAEVLAGRYDGIRPAPGYPACPDHRGKKFIFDLLKASDLLGVELTETLVMQPLASVCGYYFSHPKSSYFNIGRVTNDQLGDYARRLGVSLEEAVRFFPTNVEQ
ncbi:MAG: methionine synthase [Bacteroidales bacterium]|nr:methionine synthase [Bacteroidales bacterium]